MDIIKTWSDSVGVSILFKGTEKLEVRLGVFNGNAVSVKSLDGFKDVVKVRVAHVGVDLSFIWNINGGQEEGLDSPVEVGILVLLQ